MTTETLTAYPATHPIRRYAEALDSGADDATIRALHAKAERYAEIEFSTITIELAEYHEAMWRAEDAANVPQPTAAQANAKAEADRALRARGFELACYRGPNYR